MKRKAPDGVPPGLTTDTWAVPAAAMSEAGIAALTCVLLKKLVERAAPFHRTVAPDAKPVPLTQSVKPGPPAVALVGAVDCSSGTGPEGGGGGGGGGEPPPPPEIVKGKAPDGAPPGLATETCAVPPAAMSEAGIAALTCVLLKKLVERAEPFHRTVAPEAKPVPLTHSVKPGPPAAALVGEIDCSSGAGPEGGGGGGGGGGEPPPPVIVKAKAPEGVPPGLATETCAVPPAAMSEAGIAALTCVLLKKLVERADPFQSTVAPEAKPVPLTHSVKPGPPAAALVGESDCSTGAGPEGGGGGGGGGEALALTCTRLATEGTPALLTTKSM